MNTTFPLNKSQIKEHMVHTAAQLWQIPENEIDANFDPLFLLLLEVLASEVEQLNSEMMLTRKRLLEQLINTIQPLQQNITLPYSCVLQAQPTEAQQLLTPAHVFQTKVNSNNSQSDQYANWSPIGAFKLINLKLSHAIINQKVFEYQNNGARTKITNNESKPSLCNKITLILEAPSAEALSLQGLSIFCDLRGHYAASDLYFSLQHATVTIQDEAIAVCKGYNNRMQFDPYLFDDNGQLHTQNFNNPLHKIAKLYEPQFLHITEKKLIIPQAQLPETIQSLFIETTPPSLKNSHKLYVELELPHYFDTEVLERIQLGINAFPVCNRVQKQVYYKTEKWLNVIAIPIEGNYLAIENIVADDGYQYSLTEENSIDQLSKGSAVLQMANVSKTNSNDIRHYVNILLQSVRDEAAYFSRISNDAISNILNEIQRLLYRIEDKTQTANNLRSTQYYVLLKSRSTEEKITINYWSNNALQPDCTKPNQAFSTVNHSAVHSNHCFALTKAVGDNTKDEHKNLQAQFYHKVVSQERIVSYQDLKMLCYLIFGTKLQQVNIAKENRIGKGIQQGIQTCIHIELWLNNGEDDVQSYFLQQKLEQQLHEKASFILPYHISIHTAKNT
jgi:hypothetical protein